MCQSFTASSVCQFGGNALLFNLLENISELLFFPFID